MLISPEYREQNKRLHETRDDYGRSGHRWALTILSLAKQFGAQSILDYGCGKGTLAQTLTGPVSEYDPCIPGKDTVPEPADLVCCTDVLEHIEPECLDDVLDALRGLTKKAAFLVIATRPAKKVLEDGRNAHLIQQPVEWWLPKLWERFRVVQLSDLGGEFVVVAVPK